jgi:mRNA-degrading endonuclease HigB of HigAB toxin-antitoxin module
VNRNAHQETEVREVNAGIGEGMEVPDFGTADFRRNGIVIFNIGGNKYRLVAHFRYDIGFVYIKHVVTHTEYDTLNL